MLLQKSINMINNYFAIIRQVELNCCLMIADNGVIQ